MKRQVIAIAVGMLLISSNAFAHFAVEGSLSDIESFIQEIKQVREKSKVFDALISRINTFQRENKNFTMAIKVGRKIPPMIAGGDTQIIFLNKENSALNTNLGFIEMHLTKLEYAIDLDDVEKFPSLELDDKTGKYKLPDGVPEWAISREAIFAHEIAELFDAYKNSYDYRKNHAVAVDIENKVRKEFGQPGIRGDSEDTTIRMESGRVATGTKINIGQQHTVFIETRGNRDIVEIHYDPK